MADPTKGADSDSTQIEVDWTALNSPQNGDSNVLSYILYYDQGSSNYIEVVGESSDYTLTSYTVTGLTAGTSYKFKVAAKNAHGTGDFSNEVTIVAESVPAKLSVVVTSIDSSTGNMLVDFTAPSTNGGHAVDYYVIKVLEHGTTNTYATMTSCDGSNAGVISAKQCSVPMTELVDDHSYVLGTTPKVIAAAHNSLGDG